MLIYFSCLGLYYVRDSIVIYEDKTTDKTVAMNVELFYDEVNKPDGVNSLMKQLQHLIMNLKKLLKII